MKFLKELNLEYEKTNLQIVNKNKIDLCVKVKESLFDPERLRKICWHKLQISNIKVLLNTKFNPKMFSSYDYVIVATYSKLNSVLQYIQNSQIKCQFELCEKPIVELSKTLSNISLVIMDGPFMCIDPYGNTGLSVMGNVVHAIHHRNIGKFPVIEEKFSQLLNNGIIKNPPITNFDNFLKSASEFIPDITKARHIGSMFTIRTVLPNLEKTDARPTIVNKIAKNVITIFSGKIGNCLEAANKVANIIDNS